MIAQRYEHHTAIQQDKRCPFKFDTSEHLHDTICNWHRNIEILLVFEGMGAIQYGCEELPLRPNDVVIVNSGIFHRLYSESGISFHYVIIDESFCAENGLETRSRQFETHFQDPRTEALCLTAQALFRAYRQNPAPLQAAKLRRGVLDILIDLCENHTERADGKCKEGHPSEEYVRKALDYINCHFKKPLSLEGIAAVCGITKYHLAREFKRYTGQTVLTYVNMLRCENAAFCLANGMTVAEAAYASGFESSSYFSRTYKKLMGHSPSRQKTDKK